MSYRRLFNTKTIVKLKSVSHWIYVSYCRTRYRPPAALLIANPQSPLDRFLSRLIKSDPPGQNRSASACWSDALAPHGGAIWLGDLIELLAPLGINERLLRTSVFRLVAQNWLQSERHGRRSLYLISELGQRHTAHASQRIYEGAPQDWNGEWTLVALPRIGNGLAERAELRRELIWEGFGMIAPGLFAHPHTQASAAHDILEKLGIPDRALVLSARDPGRRRRPADSQPGLAVLEPGRCGRSSTGRSAKFRTAGKTAGRAALARRGLRHPRPATAQWRRIVLHDPHLPGPMLPDNWPGRAARELCGRLYWRVFDASEAHLDALAARDNERYTPLTADVAARFGGRPA